MRHQPAEEVDHPGASNWHPGRQRAVAVGVVARVEERMRHRQEAAEDVVGQ